MGQYVVVGGGIVGLATAHALLAADRGDSVTVVEKEQVLAGHQTGHNSGVIHSGIYYPPGSAKARMCQAGGRSIAEFASVHGIPVERTGKLIVATDDPQVPGLERLLERGMAHGLPVRRISPQEVREFEPYVSCVAALRVESTGITDYRQICEALARVIRDRGGRILLGTAVVGLSARGRRALVETSGGDVECDAVVTCAGLYADRLAAADPAAAGGVSRRERMIVPFRGEYFELRTDRRDVVKGLIYPVPDPAFPFLGVHLTRMVDGSVHAGPNAVLALAREGYDWRRFDVRDAVDTLRFPGFWRLARRHARSGAAEVLRSLSKRRFARSLQRLVPDIGVEDLVRGGAGVRAQALRRDGRLVDDFLIERAGGNVHVINAPSPAATSSLEIGRHIAAMLAHTH